MARAIGLFAVMLCIAVIGAPAVASADPSEWIEPSPNMAVPEGAELTGPCQSKPWPWNAVAPGPGEARYFEEDHLTLFIYDNNNDGWQYDDPNFDGPGVDDEVVYAIGPPADDEADESQQPDDTEDCWRWSVSNYYSPGWVPKTEGWSGYGLPFTPYDSSVDEPLIADRQGSWRMQVWRTWKHWYRWADNETECAQWPGDNVSCWDNDPDHPDPDTVAGSVLERTVDFTVSDPAVIILSGPSGTVGSAEASFDFVWPGDEEGHYECRLAEQGASWSTCSSPVTYSGLADGQHEFNVRFVLQGQDPEDPNIYITMHPWRVDTTPPRASIVDTPAGRTSASSSLIKFVSNEPEGATFRCRLDGGPAVDCSSPHRVAGLDLGHHVFEVKAIDAVSNEQADWTSSRWEVVEPAPGVPGGGGGGGGAAAGPSLVHPAPPASSNCAPVTVSPVVVVGRQGTCATTTRQGAVDIHTWRGPVTINGLPLEPNPGGFFRLKVKTDVVVAELSGKGSLDLNIVEFGVADFSHEIKRSIGKSEWKFRLLPGGSNVASEASKAVTRFAGLKMAHMPTFELNPAEGGTGRFTMVLELPEIFRGVKDGKAATDKNGGLTVEYGFTTSNTKGLKWLGKASVKKAFVFGKVTLDDLSLSLAGPPLSFEGSGKLVLARGVANHADPGVALTVGLGGDTGPFTDVNKFEIQATNIQKPLGSGVFFQRLGGQFTRCAITGGGTGAKLSANAGLSFGPRLKFDKIWEGELISADGNLTLDLCKDLVELSGSAKIVEVPVSQLRIRHQFGVITEFDATAQFSLGLASAHVNGEGWATMNAANFEGTGQLELLGDERRGDVIISSRGVAGCYTALGMNVGFRKQWGKSVEKVTNSCSVGPMKVAKPAGASGAGKASSAAADASDAATPAAGASASTSAATVRVAAKQPLHVFVARGGATPPAVVVRGPGGRNYAVPPGESPLQLKEALVLRDPETATTYVLVRAPKAGDWRVAPHADQAAAFKVLSAEGLPKPRVKAKVKTAAQTVKVKGRGGKRKATKPPLDKPILSWQLTPRPGQKVTFIERANGVVSVIAKTGAARGERRFTPVPGKGGRRTIEALVEQNGMPRTKLVVARYKAPATRRAQRVAGLTRSLPVTKRGKAKRGAKKRPAKPRAGQILRWQPQSAASEYSLVVRRADGRTIVATPKAARVRLPAATKRERLKVTILAIDRLGRPGPVRTVTLR